MPLVDIGLMWAALAHRPTTRTAGFGRIRIFLQSLARNSCRRPSSSGDGGMDVFLLLLLSENFYQRYRDSLLLYELAVYFVLSWFFSMENSVA